MANGWKQISLKLKDTECLNVQIHNLNKAWIELENLIHKDWKTLVLLINLIPRIWLISLCFGNSFGIENGS